MTRTQQLFQPLTPVPGTGVLPPVPFANFQTQSQTLASSPVEVEPTVDEAIEQLRRHFKVPRTVVERMVTQESGGRDDVTSPLGADGRFQVMPETFAGIARETGKELDINNPLDNAFAGLYLLNQNYKRFRPKAQSERHAWMIAVAGYHGNPANVERDLDAGGLGLPDQADGLINTQDHVLNIFDGTKPEDFEEDFEAGEPTAAAGDGASNRPARPAGWREIDEAQFRSWFAARMKQMRGEADKDDDDLALAGPDYNPDIVDPSFDFRAMYLREKGQSNPTASEANGYNISSQVVEDAEIDPQAGVPVPDGDPAQLKPIEFKPYEAKELPATARAAMGAAQVSHLPDVPLPVNHPDRVGEAVEVRVKANKTHDLNESEVIDAALERLGSGFGEISRRYRRETGRNIGHVGEIQSDYDERAGEYVMQFSPAQSLVRLVNAYARGGLEGAKAESDAMDGERSRTPPELQPSNKPQTLRNIIADIGVSSAQTASNVATGIEAMTTGLVHGVHSPEYDKLLAEDKKNQRVITGARESIPEEPTAARRIVRGLATGILNPSNYILGATPAGFLTAYAVSHGHEGQANVRRGLVTLAPTMAASGVAGTLAGTSSLPVRAGVQSLTGGVGNVAGSAAMGERSLGRLAEAFRIGVGMGLLMPSGKRGKVVSVEPHTMKAEKGKLPPVPRDLVKITARTETGETLEIVFDASTGQIVETPVQPETPPAFTVDAKLFRRSPYGNPDDASSPQEILAQAVHDQRARASEMPVIESALARGVDPHTGKPLSARERTELVADLRQRKFEYKDTFRQTREHFGATAARELRAQVRGLDPVPNGRVPHASSDIVAEAAAKPKREPLQPVPVEPSDAVNFNHLDISPAERENLSRLVAETAPTKRVVTFDDVRREAAELDPAIVAKLKPVEAGETLNPAVRYAARTRLNALNGESVKLRADIEAQRNALPATEIEAMERQVALIEHDAKQFIDVLYPTRSQDGRNLAYHRMMAESSFDVEHWVSKARARAERSGEDIKGTKWIEKDGRGIPLIHKERRKRRHNHLTAYAEHNNGMQRTRLQRASYYQRPVRAADAGR